MEEFTSGSDLINIGADMLGKYMGKTDDPLVKKQIGLAAAVQNAMGVLISGADISVEQLKKIKAQLPMPGQSRETFRQNMLLSRENLARARKYKRKARGNSPSSPEQNSPPADIRTIDGIKYEYMKLPDGTTQRRTI